MEKVFFDTTNKSAYCLFQKRADFPLLCKLLYWCAANCMQSNSSEIDSGSKIDTYFCVGDLLNGQAQRNPFHFPLQKIKNSFNI